MPIHYVVDPDYENLLISTVVPPLDPLIDSQAALKAIASYLDTITGKIGILSDLRQLDTSFADIIIGLATIAFKEDSPFRNERLVIAQVTDRTVYEMISEWLKDDLYGALTVPTFKSYHEAKSYLVQKITDETT